MSKIGYKEEAILYDLDDNFIQSIKVRAVSKRVVNGSFMGSGKLSQGQTLDIATKDKLNQKVKATYCRCFYDANYYLVGAILSHDTKPLKNKSRKEKEFVLFLQ